MIITKATVSAALGAKITDTQTGASMRGDIAFSAAATISGADIAWAARIVSGGGAGTVNVNTETGEVTLLSGLAAAASTLFKNGTGNTAHVWDAAASGWAGNSIRIRYVKPTTANAALSVMASGTDITVSLATGAGTAQVETATAAGTVTTAGNATVTVTSALFTPARAVSVVVADNDTAADWADKVRTALAADPVVSAHYNVSGSSTSIVLTAKLPAANDSTLNIALANGTCSGITPAASSANTTAGVAPAITTTVNQLISAAASIAALATVELYPGSDGSGTVPDAMVSGWVNFAGGADDVAITDGDGKDLTGADFPDAARLLALAVQVGQDGGGSISWESDTAGSLHLGAIEAGGFRFCYFGPDGIEPEGGIDVDIDFEPGKNQTVTIYLVAKSTV